MRNKRKTLITGTIIVVLVLAVGGGVLAWGPGHHFGNRFPEMILAHVDDRVEDLELNEAQQTEYQALRKQLEANLYKAQKERRAAFKEVKQALANPNPDASAVTGLIKKRLDLVPQIMGANLDLLARFYQILDDEQKAKVLNKTRKRMERIERFAMGS